MKPWILGALRWYHRIMITIYVSFLIMIPAIEAFNCSGGGSTGPMRCHGSTATTILGVVAGFLFLFSFIGAIFIIPSIVTGLIVLFVDLKELKAEKKSWCYIFKRSSLYAVVVPIIGIVYITVL